MPSVTVDASGNANMSIPLELPVSNSLKPDISLAYNSNINNGIFGIGWQMPSLAIIGRDSSFGIHYDINDKFYSSLGGRLIKIADGSYRTRIETYSKFESFGTCGVGPCYWKVTDKNGVKYYFGNTEDSRIEVLDLPPGKSNSVKIWALNRVEDSNGNFYSISYIEESGFYYPKSIAYSDKTIEFILSNRADVNKEYAENIHSGMDKIITGIEITSAGEIFRKYTLHYEVGSSKRSRLKKVTLDGYKDLSLDYSDSNNSLEELGNAAGTPVNVSQSIHLDYRVPFYNQAKCNEIKMYCDCSASSACRVAAAKEGKDVREDCAEGVALMGEYCILGMQIGPTILMDDVDKDGKTDLIKITGGKNDNHIYVTKITESEFQEYPASPSWEFRINSFITTADIDGDNQKELWIVEENNKTLKIVRPDNYVFNQVFDTNIVVDNIGYDPEDIKLTSKAFASDMNSDGKTDFIMLYDLKSENKSRFKIYLSNGTNFDSPFEIDIPYVDSETHLQYLMDIDSDRHLEWITIERENLNKIVVSRIDIDSKTSSSSEYSFHFNKSTNYKNISFADINGDGKQDIIGVMQDSSVSVCLFTGDSFTDPNNSDSLEPKPQFLEIDDDSNTFEETQNTKAYADINSDRKADLITYNGTNKKVYVSYSNGKGFPQYDLEKEAVGFKQLAEINGDGKVDIISLSLKERVKKTPFLFTLDGFFVESMDINEYEPVADFEILYSDKSHSDLITKVATNDGQELNIHYDFVRDIDGAIQPESGNYPNLTNLAPEHLVTSVEKKLSNDLPIQKETYSYTDSKIHVGKTEDMGQLGFKTTQKEVSLITPEGEFKKLSTQVMEFKQSDPLDYGKPVTIKNYKPDGKLHDETNIKYEKVTTSNGTIAHRIKSKESTQYDNGSYFSKSSISFTYDNNGNITNEVLDVEGNITDTTRTFSPDYGNWKLDKISTFTKKSDGEVVDNRKFSYTGVNLTSSSVEIESGKWATLNFTYDDSGNIISIVDPIGKTSTIGYNQNSQIIEITNHLGHTVSYDYDPTSGIATKKTDQNGGITEVEHDKYGRITELTNPGEVDWSKKFFYTRSINDHCIEKRERITQNSGSGVSIIPLPLIGTNDLYTWKKICFDAEGKIKKRENSAEGDNVLTEDFVYDYLGRLISQSEPYVSGIEIPKYTIWEYNDPESRVTKLINPDGNETTYSYDGFVVTKNFTDKPTEIITNNVLGQVVSQEIGDLTTTYSYDKSGNVDTISKADGSQVSIEYDMVGNILSKTDSNSGKVSYTYDLIGNLMSTKDARGITINYFYDEKGRLKKYSAGGEEVEYFFDENQENAKGKVTKVKDSSGETQFFFDQKGNMVKKIRSIEDYKIQFEYVYDSINRISKIIYPDGTIVSYVYDDRLLSEIRMDTTDGKAKNLKLVGYQYDNSQNKLVKTFGNGVVIELNFDSNTEKLTSSKLTTGTTKRVEEHRKYFYDPSGNISTINDLANPWRSQTFNYDSYNRLMKSKGSYGERDYTYTQNGNLTKKGDTTMDYTSTKHTNAVTSVRIPNEISSVTHSYVYDEAGYIQKRDNDTFTHDEFGRLSSIVTGFGEEFNYFYDYKARRIKKINRNKDEVTYYFGDGLYEIHVTPSKPTRHTLYVKNGEELIAQWTKTDAVLTQEEIDSSFLLLFWNNQNYVFLFLFLVLLIALLIQPKSTNLCLSVFMLRLNSAQVRGKNPYVLTLSIISVVLFITCTKSKDEFPFFAFTSLIGVDTPSVNDTQSNEDGTGGGGSANAPIEGLYFFHTDHLDSVTMLTNTNGELVSGTSIGSGRSIVSYTPYGEIDRDHSGGPDIYRYKYTGQEEDKETGLYYYKARYYDPKIGRFLQPDSVMEVSSPFGTNQYMYVEGNPIMYNDPSGNWKLFGKKSKFEKLSHKFGNFMKRLAKEVGYAQQMQKQADQINLFLTTPGGLENAFKMYFLAKFLGKPSKTGTVFGHNYTGDGNRDDFANFYSKKYGRSKWVQFMIGTTMLDIPSEQAEAFYSGILPHLRAKPKSFADSLAQRHDDDVPGTLIAGDMQEHRSADAHYYKAWGDGLLTGRGGFWEKPLDSIFVGGFGSLFLLTHEVCVTRGIGRVVCGSAASSLLF